MSRSRDTLERHVAKLTESQRLLVRDYEAEIRTHGVFDDDEIVAVVLGYMSGLIDGAKLERVSR